MLSDCRRSREQPAEEAASCPLLSSSVPFLAALDYPDCANRAVVGHIQAPSHGISIADPIANLIPIAAELRSLDALFPLRREQGSAAGLLGCYGKRRAYTGWQNQHRAQRD